MSSNIEISPMQEYRACKQNLCTLCHPDLIPVVPNRYDVPDYAKPTQASLSRLLERTNERMRLKRLTIPSKPHRHQASRLGFENLPAEIRLQVYRECIAVNAETGSLFSKAVAICGHVKGGGFHADYSHSSSSPQMLMFASTRFHAQILRLNSSIYAEASREIYQHISVRFFGRIPSADMPLLKSWLNYHPFQHTAHVTFSMIKDLSDKSIYPSFDTRCNLRSTQLDILARILSRMPQLRCLDIYVFLRVTRKQAESHGMASSLKYKSWIHKIAEFQTKLSGRTQMTVYFWFDAPNGVVKEYDQAYIDIQKRLKARGIRGKIAHRHNGPTDRHMWSL